MASGKFKHWIESHEKNADAKAARKAQSEAAEESKREEELKQDREFNWIDDFGRPSVMIDALGAQTSLEVVNGPDESGK